MSSVDIFYLDEEGDKDATTSSSPASSTRDATPVPATSSAQVSTTPVTSATPSAATTTTLQIPSTPLLSQPQAFGRKSGVFAATPSFPSPLAQAITVPSQSDSSSSSHSSPHASDDENDNDNDLTAVSETPKLRPDHTVHRVPSSGSNSESSIPSSPRRSASRPPSPSQSRQALTPGALLINRVRRSGSGSSYLVASSSGSGSKSSPPRSMSAQRHDSVQFPRGDAGRDISPGHSLPGSTSGSSRGTLSETANAGGSSPLTFGSPELEPAPEIAAPRPISVASPSPSGGRDANILGLGWVPNWDGPESSLAKAKARDMSRPSSTRRELASPIPLSSAPRQRRASEFLRPASMDMRKMPPPSPTTGRLVTSALPTLSSSASMVSPLNPLPSPWSEVPLSSSLSGTDLSSSTASASGAAMRVNKVPTSVRLAADLMKSTQPPQTPPLQQGETPTSTASVPTPNPSPADSVTGTSTARKQALGHSVSLPPGSFNPQTSPTTQRWNTTDHPDFSSLSPQSSVSVSSGVSSVAPARVAIPVPGAARPPSADLTKGWVDSLALQQPRSQLSRSSPHDSLVSPPPLIPASPSPIQTLSPASAAGSSSVTEDASSSGTSRADGRRTPGGVGFPGAAAHSRLRSVAHRGGLAMDLAGVSSAIGDAASHANMIIQSRQAKVQRWRPRNAALVYSPPSYGSPDSRLSASYMDQPGSQWGGRTPGSYHPRSGSSTLPSTQGRVEVPGLPAIDTQSPPPRPPFASVEMEKQVSATGSIAGIEWVDWYDCYKAYKAEKIRAEKDAARHEHEPGSLLSKGTAPPRSEREQHNDESSSWSHADGTLTPVSSHDETGAASLPLSHSNSLSFRHRSLSIRSTMSALDHKISPGSKRSGILERPRQTSGGSNRSSVAGDSQTSALKRKKNLVTKMEGWWNAVKSNFNHDNPSSPRLTESPGNMGTTRAPSAPQSRRGSEKSTGTLLDSGLLVPQPVRRASSASSRSLQAMASNVDIRGEDRSRTTSPAPSPAMAASLTNTASLPPPPPVHFGAMRQPPRETLVRRGLESRRNQPSLRLDLEPAALGLSPMERGNSATTIQQGNAAHTATRSDSGSSSFGSGVLAGVGRWDQTPAPLSTATSGPTTTTRDDKPVAPGADVTVASVRQHVKQRLDAAKVQCDNTLRKIVATISAYEEERIATEVMDDLRRDYFETFSDSPLVDAVESEDDSAIPPIGSFSSRGPSRRGSMSLSTNVLSSPSRRVAMLSSVPTSPRRSMSRRRPSIVPRVLARDIQQASRLYVDATQSTSSSRSTSRSRSPMPHARPFVTNQPAMEEALEADGQFLAALQELIVLATDVLETSVDSLISRPTSCAEVIKKIQKTGQYWDEHEDWPGRDWYVDILMAVAGLSRVLDWWQAEKGFWNFDDDENEPLTFVMRPFKDTPQFDLGAGSSARSEHSVSTSPLVLPSAGPSSSANILALSTLSPPEHPPAPATTKEDETSQAIEDLRRLAEQAKSINIVMELSLQGQEILYVNEAIYEVVGWEPEDVLDVPISELLAPADTSHFAEATDRLLEDDGTTVELRFRFEVHDIEDAPEGHDPGPIYIELEGVGMVISENNEPSHTMWVMKPVTACKVDHITDIVFPRDGHISTECVLCRICEREIVVWFFEKHNETCDAVHRLEAEISTSNESLNEIHQTLTKLVNDMDAVRDASQQGVLFLALPDCVSNNSAELSSPQAVEIRKVDNEDVRNVIEILEIAKAIETPSVQPDEADLPFNLQRYLTRESEDRLSIITGWHKPATVDRTVGLLFSHVEDQLRCKQKAIARMQSTIRYSEKTRHEWEDKVNQIFADSDDGTASDSGSDDVTSPVDSTLAPEQTSPGHRKIAPLARLPITQGHPQRPGTVSYTSQASIATTMVAPTPRARTESATTKLPTPSTMMPTPSAPPAGTTSASDPFVAPVPTTHSTSSLLTVPSDLALNNVDISLAQALGPNTRSPEVFQSDDNDSQSQSPALPEQAFHSPKPKKGHGRRFSIAPVSPRVPSAGLPGARAPQPSIKDFQIIKPISRGAFGSVYLAKKVATGDYYAIKALKKSDMIAKNQITNVKAERTILMNQASSPYVVKLFFSFQSKDYLYLVMEYLNGGDCSTLVKTLGSLPVDWARNYIGELVLGLEYLHARNVAHRDIKPDNLLIDARGHLKLTDFGLSKIGLLNRQIGGPRPPYLKGTSLRSAAVRRASSVSSSDSPLLSPDLMLVAPQSNLSQSYFPHVSESGSADESSGSDSAGILPRHLRHAKLPSDAGTANSGTEPPRFVGTPDYLAPESILGGGADDRMVDWWAVGVVLYEFLYGFPPFHAESPEKVFDNVVSRRINWHEDDIDVPPEAHDLMDRLMCTNPAQRLGARGAEEVKQHAFFAGVNWDTLTSNPAVFIPDGTDPESTDYFDSRGANKAFIDDEGSPKAVRGSGAAPAGSEPVVTPGGTELHHDAAQSDDFGAFTFKNLPVLKQANDDVIRKMRSQSMAGMEIPKPLRYKPGASRNLPPSPSTSTSSAASTPSRATAPITPGFHARRPSELNALSRVKSTDDDPMRRFSVSGRFRAGSISDASASDHGGSGAGSIDLWKQRRQTPPESVQLVTTETSSQQSLNVLIAEDNPITQKILETLLTRLGCRCVCVRDGPDALAVTGNLKFDAIFLDMHMPFVSGEQVARMIRSTTNPNQNSPIIAATAFDETMTEEGTLFSAVITKPFSKPELLRCLSKVGFIVTSAAGAGSGTESSPIVA